MAHYLYAFLAALGIMTLLDAVWLGAVAPKFYKKHIGFIMAKKPNWFAAVLFYFIYVLGITVFVVYPGWDNGYSMIRVGLSGALLGLVAYATYDLTNQATLEKWPRIVTVVDLLWGTVLTSTVSILAILLLRSFL